MNKKYCCAGNPIKAVVAALLCVVMVFGAAPAAGVAADTDTVVAFNGESFMYLCDKEFKISASFTSATLDLNASTVSFRFSVPEAFEVLGEPELVGDASSGTVSISAKGLTVGQYTLTVETSDTASATCTIVVTSKIFTVTYNACNGIGAPTGQKKAFESPLQLSAVVPTKVCAVTYDVGHHGTAPESGNIQCIFKGWNSDKNGKGTSYAPGDYYDVNSNVVLYAQWELPELPKLTAPECIFAGWYDSAVGGMPINAAELYTNQSLYARWIVERSSETIYRQGDIIEFGSYPQSEVTDPETLEALNSQPLDWVSYGYYSGTGSVGTMVQGDWMKFADTTFEGEKYRAVFFTAPRPYCIYADNTDSTLSGRSGYYKDTVYWFKYEPLRWVLLDVGGSVMCESIIDAQPFNSTVYGSVQTYSDPGMTKYANDYISSSIRAWLNNDFYNTAFTGEEQRNIYPVDIYTETPYGNIRSRDRIFLLSSSEVTRGSWGFKEELHTDRARRAAGSDYARSQGLFDTAASAQWYLRTHGIRKSFGGTQYYDSVNVVDRDGYTAAPMFGYSAVYNTDGIRPAMRLDLSFMLIGEIVSDTGTRITIDDEIINVGPNDGFNINVSFDSLSLAFEPASVSYYFSRPGYFQVVDESYFTDTDTSGKISMRVIAPPYIGTYYVTVETSDGAGSTRRIIVSHARPRTIFDLLLDGFGNGGRNFNVSGGTYLEGFVPQDTVGNVAAQLETGVDLMFLSAKGTPLDSTDMIGTGCKLRLMEDGEIIEEKTVVVAGDTSGDGFVDSADISIVGRAASMLSELDELQMLAADMNGDGIIDSMDMSIISRVAVLLEVADDPSAQLLNQPDVGMEIVTVPLKEETKVETDVSAAPADADDEYTWWRWLIRILFFGWLF